MAAGRVHARLELTRTQYTQGPPPKRLVLKNKSLTLSASPPPRMQPDSLTIRSMGDVTDKEGKRIYRLYIYKIELRIKKDFDIMYRAKKD
jgi:hypothetical protein